MYVLVKDFLDSYSSNRTLSNTSCSHPTFCTTCQNKNTIWNSPTICTALDLIPEPYVSLCVWDIIFIHIHMTLDGCSFFLALLEQIAARKEKLKIFKMQWNQLPPAWQNCKIMRLLHCPIWLFIWMPTCEQNLINKIFKV